MEPEKIKELVEKINNGTSTSEEENELLKELNKGITALRNIIKIVKEN